MGFLNNIQNRFIQAGDDLIQRGAENLTRSSATTVTRNIVRDLLPWPVAEGIKFYQRGDYQVTRRIVQHNPLELAEVAKGTVEAEFHKRKYAIQRTSALVRTQLTDLQEAHERGGLPDMARTAVSNKSLTTCVKFRNEMQTAISPDLPEIAKPSGFQREANLFITAYRISILSTTLKADQLTPLLGATPGASLEEMSLRLLATSFYPLMESASSYVLIPTTMMYAAAKANQVGGRGAAVATLAGTAGATYSLSKILSSSSGFSLPKIVTVLALEVSIKKSTPSVTNIGRRASQFLPGDPFDTLSNGVRASHHQLKNSLSSISGKMLEELCQGDEIKYNQRLNFALQTCATMFVALSQVDREEGLSNVGPFYLTTLFEINRAIGEVLHHFELTSTNRLGTKKAGALDEFLIPIFLGAMMHTATTLLSTSPEEGSEGTLLLETITILGSTLIGLPIVIDQIASSPFYREWKRRLYKGIIGIPTGSIKEQTIDGLHKVQLFSKAFLPRSVATTVDSVSGKINGVVLIDGVMKRSRQVVRLARGAYHTVVRATESGIEIAREVQESAINFKNQASAAIAQGVDQARAVKDQATIILAHKVARTANVANRIGILGYIQQANKILAEIFGPY